MSNTATPGVPTVVFSYDYDAVDNLLTRVDTVAGQVRGTNTYVYDALNRASRITQSGNGVAEKRVDLTYDVASQLTSLTRFANLAGSQPVVTSTHEYDDAGRRTELVHARGGTDLARYAWTYDAADRITRLVSPDGITDYSYDATDQLVAADHSLQIAENYSYDSNGNRTSAGYSTARDNRLTSDGDFNYEYDAEGNRTRRTFIATGEVTDYEWDHRNRLVRAVIRNSTGSIIRSIAYTYDMFDRRIAKTIDSDGAGPAAAASERFVYDGPHIALSFDGAGGQTHRYLHGTAVDQILADEQSSGAILWPLSDHLETVRDLVDSSGVIQNHLRYDTFGQIIAESNAGIDHLYAFAGREFDTETGLYNYRRRYYDPKIGQFLSPDPAGFNGGDLNLHAYVLNNPVSYSDPSGLGVPLVWAIYFAGESAATWIVRNQLRILASTYLASYFASGGSILGTGPNDARAGQQAMQNVAGIMTILHFRRDS